MAFNYTCTGTHLPHLVGPRWLISRNPPSCPLAARLQTQHYHYILSHVSPSLTLLWVVITWSYLKLLPDPQPQSCPWGHWSSICWFPSGGNPRCLRNPLQEQDKHITADPFFHLHNHYTWCLKDVKHCHVSTKCTNTVTMHMHPVSQYWNDSFLKKTLVC